MQWTGLPVTWQAGASIQGRDLHLLLCNPECPFHQPVEPIRLTTWSGVPGGILAPSLAIGGALGHDVSQLFGYANSPTLIALGMAGFLAAVTQAAHTFFIIVMEMMDGHALVLSLMTCAFVASGISKIISAPLYASLAMLQLKRLPALST